MPSCIPAGIDIPGMPGGPQWWEPAGTPREYWGKPLAQPDPRWNGATRRTYNYGTAEQGGFRAKYAVEAGQPVLYLAWEINLDPTLNAGSDAVIFGIQGASGVPHVFEIGAYSGGGAAANPRPTASRTLYKQNPGTIRWITDSTTPFGWINDARSWLESSASGTTHRWAIHVRVPSMAAGDLNDTGVALGALGTEFLFFYAIVKDTAVGAVPYKWPRDVASPYLDDATGEMVFPAPATWDRVKLGTGADCAPGISLNAFDIGTKNTDPATGLPAPHLILVSTTNPPTNHLYALPANGMAQQIPAGALHASFRTANWGSQTAWSFKTAPGATAWEEVLPGTPKTNAAAIPAPAGGAPPKGEITFAWTIPAAQAGDWIPPSGSKFKHQCMLVTLSAPAHNFDFVNDSAYRNMDFVPASEFEREVDIDVRGALAAEGGLGARPAAAGRSQDVYIQVQQDNMPRKVPPGRPHVPKPFRDVFEPGKPVRFRDLETLGVARADVVSDVSGARIARRPEEPGGVEPGRAPLPTFDDLAEALTTVRYFVYRDTGRRIRVGGHVRRLLEEQTSFGYFVEHTGPVRGWDHALGGPFAKVAPNVYRLPVPTEGVQRIATKIVAYERALPRVRMSDIVAGPKARVQPRIPVLKNFPGLGSIVNRVTHIRQPG